MNTTPVTVEIEKVIAELRPLGDARFTVHYVNEHRVPVKRHVFVDAEQVDPVALRLEQLRNTVKRAADKEVVA